MSEADPIICEQCDTVHRAQPLKPRQSARCVRCGALLYRHSRLSLQAMLAVTLASLIVFVIANGYPIVTLESHGERSQTTLLGAVLAADDAGIGAVAVAAAAMVFLFPLLQMLLFVYVLLPLVQRRVPRGFGFAMHLLRHIEPWSMVEVFVLGVLVAVVKLGGLATVIPQPGLWAFAALTVLLTVLNGFDARALWDAAERIQR
jgi:paraquat-inducible protein A